MPIKTTRGDRNKFYRELERNTATRESFTPSLNYLPRASAPGPPTSTSILGEHITHHPIYHTQPRPLPQQRQHHPVVAATSRSGGKGDTARRPFTSATIRDCDFRDQANSEYSLSSEVHRREERDLEHIRNWAEILPRSYSIDNPLNPLIEARTQEVAKVDNRTIEVKELEKAKMSTIEAALANLRRVMQKDGERYEPSRPEAHTRERYPEKSYVRERDIPTRSKEFEVSCRVCYRDTS